MSDQVTPRFRPSRSERLRKPPKPKREGNDEKHLSNLRRLPCCICGNPPPNTVHHLKATGQRGVSYRSPDKFGLPMCWWPNGQNCHGEIEKLGSKKELAWFEKRGINAIDLAGALWSNKHSFSAMEAVLAAHRPKGKDGPKFYVREDGKSVCDWRRK